MFSTQRFTAKELALAYVSQQQQPYTPLQFLNAVEKMELEFSRLLKTPRQNSASATSTMVFEG